MHHDPQDRLLLTALSELGGHVRSDEKYAPQEEYLGPCVLAGDRKTCSQLHCNYLLELLRAECEHLAEFVRHPDLIPMRLRIYAKQWQV